MRQFPHFCKQIDIHGKSFSQFLAFESIYRRFAKVIFLYFEHNIWSEINYLCNHAFDVSQTVDIHQYHAPKLLLLKAGNFKGFISTIWRDSGDYRLHTFFQ